MQLHTGNEKKVVGGAVRGQELPEMVVSMLEPGFNSCLTHVLIVPLSLSF